MAINQCDRSYGKRRQSLVRAFSDRFGLEPDLVVRAPGRVNLIGEHTDYNEGFVLPMAIDRALWISLRPRTDDQVIVHALDLDQAVAFSARAPRRGGSGWVEYVKGVAWSLQEAGYVVRGWEGVVSGDVPRGAGLSSSAALELATARAFCAASQFQWDAAQMAKICQRAENEWVGVRCGIMDQMISATARAGHALLIDCRDLTTRPVPLPTEAIIVVLDTATQRTLTDSGYNTRRKECEAAAEALGVRSLRDVQVADLKERGGALSGVLRRRARHVLRENARVLRAAEAMRGGDLVELGRLMDASHASLRDDFEVSTRELDAIVSCARREEGCYGARMTGAGFGGCAIALVQRAVATTFVDVVTACYLDATRMEARAYVCSAAEGAEVVVS